jgi:uncharacterized DUF497 family protein
MKFEWDETKATRNSAKHGVTFEEATEAFEDADKIEIYQRVRGEDRWWMLARAKKRLLVVAYRDDDDTVRIISAREAEKHEKARYINR